MSAPSAPAATVAPSADVRVGVGAALLVALMFASMDMTAKLLTERFDPLFVVWARYASQTVGVMLIFAPRLRTTLRTERFGLQLARSACLFTATMLFFSAFAVLPLADGTAIAQIAPLLITAMAALVLGETVGPRRWAAVAIGLIGALIIIRPGAGVFGWAALLPVGGAFAFATFSILTRMLGRTESVWTTFVYTTLVGAVCATLFLPFVWSTPRLADLPLLLMVGTFGAVGQLALIVALRNAPASVIAPINYTQLIWAGLLGALVFSQTPDAWTAVGAAVIVTAGLFAQWRERLAARRGG